MCLAIPAKVLEIKGEYAKVDFGGIMKQVIITLLDHLEIGQYVIVHAGYAIEVMNEKEGLETKQILDEMLEVKD